jgi:3-methyladenine DNA glycosylase Tag
MAVFDDLDPEKIASYTDEIRKILLDERIIRNRLKVFSTGTMRAYLICRSGIDLIKALWSFSDGNLSRKNSRG